MRKTLLGVLAALLITGASVLATASPAAARSTKPGDPAGASVSGAYTFASNVRWWSKSYFYLNLLVRDTEADGVHAEGRVQTKDSSGRITSYPWHKAVGQYDQWVAKDTHVSNSAGIRSMRVEACRFGKALPTTCSYSSWKPNPWY